MCYTELALTIAAVAHVDVAARKRQPVTCPYCGTLKKEKLERCPSCGAPPKKEYHHGRHG